MNRLDRLRARVEERILKVWEHEDQRPAREARARLHRQLGTRPNSTSTCRSPGSSRLSSGQSGSSTKRFTRLGSCGPSGRGRVRFVRWTTARKAAGIWKPKYGSFTATPRQAAQRRRQGKS